MSTVLDKLNDHFAIISDIHEANALLGWDENVYMPPGAATRAVSKRPRSPGLLRNAPRITK